MTALIGGLLGAVGGFGIFVVVQGWRGALTRPTRTNAGWVVGEDVNRRVGVALAAIVVMWFATRWPVGAVLAGVAGWWGPGVVADSRKRAAQIAKTEAIASWTEQLRDVVSAAAGISEALVSTARVAPLPIRAEVEDLARRLRREDPDRALAQFAVDLDHPVGDQVVVTLRLSMSERGERLSDVLSAIAEAARDQATGARNIEASRSKLWRQAFTVTAVLVGVFVILLLFQRDYLAAYSTLGGQIVIAVIGILWGSALRMMVQLAQVAEQPRILNAGQPRQSPRPTQPIAGGAGGER